MYDPLVLSECTHRTIGAEHWASRLWCLKLVVVDLLRTMLQRLWYYREVFYALYCILGATFIAAFASVLLECKPLGDYWQVDFDFDAW